MAAGSAGVASLMCGGVCKSPQCAEHGCAGERRALDAKLAVFDAQAERAVDELVAWLTDRRADLVALARGRHVEGHYRYGDANFLEWGDGELLAQTAQELADAIVYQSRTIHRRRLREHDHA